MMETLGRAARYLEKSQHMDGSWGAGDPFVCARATLALQASAGAELAQGLGVRYIERCQTSDGGFPAKGITYTDAACTAYALIVLNRFDYSKASLPVSRGLIWLLEHQSSDGSWSGRNTSKNAYTTSLCLRALHQYYFSGLGKYRKGVDHVLNKTAEPGFFTEPVSHVYAPVLNLAKIGRLADGLKASFVAFAGSRLGGAMTSGEVADVAYLVGTLGALGESEALSDGSRWLVSSQRPDGGFGEHPGSESDPNRTALVVLALTNNL